MRGNIDNTTNVNDPIKIFLKICLLLINMCIIDTTICSIRSRYYHLAWLLPFYFHGFKKFTRIFSTALEFDSKLVTIKKGNKISNKSFLVEIIKATHRYIEIMNNTCHMSCQRLPLMWYCVVRFPSTLSLSAALSIRTTQFLINCCQQRTTIVIVSTVGSHALPFEWASIFLPLLLP